jgi:hypothetical protein
MSRLDVFSKRNRDRRNEKMVFDDVPWRLKNQIVHTWNSFLYQKSVPTNLREAFWRTTFLAILKEHGHGRTIYHKSLVPKRRDQIEKYFLELQDYKLVLDIIEILFRGLHACQTAKKDLQYSYDDAVNELNSRFFENNIGYRLENRIIIRVDEELIHESTIKPLFQILKNEKYDSINQELSSAFRHHRTEELSACIVEAFKALESTMKVIIAEKDDPASEPLLVNQMVKRLIDLAVAPSYTNNLLTGLATIRNQFAHGKADRKLTPSKHLSSFVLNVTASTIKFLLESLNTSSTNMTRTESAANL